MTEVRIGGPGVTTDRASTTAAPAATTDRRWPRRVTTDPPVTTGHPETDQPATTGPVTTDPTMALAATTVPIGDPAATIGPAATIARRERTVRQGTIDRAAAVT